MTGRIPWGGLLLLLAALLDPGRAKAAAPGGDARLCLQAIAATDRAGPMPPGLLNAIAAVESGRRDSRSNAVLPWPWAVNAGGVGAFFDTEAEAIAAVQALQAAGERSIDVGCMQINLMHHPTAFPTLAEAFDPGSNVRYARVFLRQLFGETGDWNKAAAAYHSRTAEIGAEYGRRVAALWSAPPVPPPPRNPDWTPEFAAAMAAAALDRSTRIAADRYDPAPVRAVAGTACPAQAGGSAMPAPPAASRDAARCRATASVRYASLQARTERLFAADAPTRRNRPRGDRTRSTDIEGAGS